MGRVASTVPIGKLTESVSLHRGESRSGEWELGTIEVTIYCWGYGYETKDHNAHTHGVQNKLINYMHLYMQVARRLFKHYLAGISSVCIKKATSTDKKCRTICTLLDYIQDA